MSKRWVLAMLALCGCTGVIMGPPGSADGPGDGAGPDAGTDVDGHPPSWDGGPPGWDASTPDEPDAGSTMGRTASETCARWNADRINMQEGAWTGDVSACAAGDIEDPGRGNALRLVNLYRWLADLPPVTTNPDLDTRAQACALMMRANNQLSHAPPDTWACYTSDGAGAAGRSNISSGPGVRSVDAYMNDWSSPNSLGHRRWILSAGLGPIGIGSTDRHSCLWVIGGAANGGPDWTAFPPPGPFPIDAARSFGHTLDGSGWSIQSNRINLRDAEVTITANGQTLPVTVTSLAAGYGSSSAISMVPEGWTTQAGTTYRVRVTGLSQVIAYDVRAVDCAP